MMRGDLEWHKKREGAAKKIVAILRKLPADLEMETVIEVGRIVGFTLDRIDGSRYARELERRRK